MERGIGFLGFRGRVVEIGWGWRRRNGGTTKDDDKVFHFLAMEVGVLLEWVLLRGAVLPWAFSLDRKSVV